MQVISPSKELLFQYHIQSRLSPHLTGKQQFVNSILQWVSNCLEMFKGVGKINACVSNSRELFAKVSEFICIFSVK